MKFILEIIWKSEITFIFWKIYNYNNNLKRNEYKYNVNNGKRNFQDNSIINMNIYYNSSRKKIIQKVK